MLETLIVFGAQYAIVLPFLALATYAWWQPPQVRWDLLHTVLVALPLAYLLARLAGMLYGHPQPFVLEGFEPLVPHEVNNAFPSDHVALTSVVATLALWHNRLLGIALSVVVALIAASRILAGLHYPLDVLVGAALGVGVVYASATLLHVFQRASMRP